MDTIYKCVSCTYPHSNTKSLLCPACITLQNRYIIVCPCCGNSDTLDITKTVCSYCDDDELNRILSLSPDDTYDLLCIMDQEPIKFPNQDNVKYNKKKWSWQFNNKLSNIRLFKPIKI